MPNHGDHFCINQFLRYGGANFRITLIIFRHHLELDQLAADFDFLVVRLSNRKRNPIFIILAQVRRLDCQRAGVADLDRNARLSNQHNNFRRFDFNLFFTATNQSNRQQGCERECV